MDLTIENLEHMDDASASAFWRRFSGELAKGDDSAARATLAAGRPVYYREHDTPVGLFIKEYPDGHRDLVELGIDNETFVRHMETG